MLAKVTRFFSHQFYLALFSILQYVLFLIWGRRETTEEGGGAEATVAGSPEILLLAGTPTGSYASNASWNRTRKLPKEYCILLKSPQNNLKHHHHFKSNEVMGSKCYKCERRYLMNATSSESHESYELHTHQVSKGILDTIKDVMDVLFKFSRPYVLIAMVLNVTSTSLLVVEKLSDLSPAFFVGLFQYLAAFYFSKVYHVGLNELVDVEIDKINKPHLAMASGKYSSRIGVFVTTLSLFMSFGIGWIVGSRPMLWGLLASFVLGTAYSANLPLLRWKRFAPLALLYMVANSMICFYLASFLHMKIHVLKRAATFPRSMIFTFAMMGVYWVVLGFAKDIPDMEGDKAGGIQTFALWIGAERVFWFCVSLLEIAYGVAIIVGSTSPFLWSKIVMISAHAIMALALFYNAKSVDLKRKASAQSFYMFVFKLLCAEGIVIALSR